MGQCGAFTSWGRRLFCPAIIRPDYSTGLASSFLPSCCVMVHLESWTSHQRNVDGSHFIMIEGRILFP
jgi:hypothetical protein